MVWNVLSIELVQILTYTNLVVLMDQDQRLKSFVLIQFCNGRVDVGSSCGRAAESGNALSSFLLL